MIRFLQTPSPLKKAVLGGILLLICAAMVISFIPGGLATSLGIGAPGQGVVATVEGEQITAPEVQREAKQMVAQQFRNAGAQAAALLPFFAQRAADNLIDQQVILAEAHHLGLRSTDEELREELQHGRYAQTFFPGGNFIGQTEYENLLQQNNLTVATFEQGVKDQIVFDKLRNLVAGSASVTDAEVRQEFNKQNDQVKFDYAVITKEDVMKDIHPSEAELKSYYQTNQAKYKNSIPEKRKIQYAVLDKSRLLSQVQVSQADLQSYYDQHTDEYRVAEQVNVRHILIKTPTADANGKVDPKGIEDAHQRAADVLKQLKAGGDFSALATKYSEDPGSAKNGGSLGWIVRGRTVPEFEKSAFSLPKGGTSDLVQTSYGFHIIHIDDKQDAHLKSLAEVTPQIAPLIKQQKAEQAAEGQANALVVQVRSQGLDKAAASKGLSVITTDFVAKSDSLPGIGSAPQFMDAVFNAADKAPADEAQIPSGFVIFQLQAIKPAATPTFDEIRSRVESEFKEERSTSLLSQKTQELSDRAKASHDLKKAAKELGASIKSTDGFVKPDAQVQDIGAMSGPANVAFSLKVGDISGPLVNATDGAVLRVTAQQAPSEEEYAQKSDQIRDSLLQGKQQELFGIFVVNLRDQMEKSGKIKINDKELKNLTHAQGGEGEEGD